MGDPVVARDEATAESDIDILVTFEREPETSWGCYAAQSYLSDLFGRPVDMVERPRMRKEYLPWVEADEIDPMNPRLNMPDGSCPKRWDIHIQDMLDKCGRVLEYTRGVDRAAFLTNREKCDATVRNVELIGEAARRVPERVREAHPEIPWQTIIDARNHLIHGYDDIDDETLCQIVQHHVPHLTKRLFALLAQAQAEARESEQ